jgi:hypothetical protein
MDNPVIDQHGTKTWYQHGKVHRDDGPAYENTDGHKWWFQHGNCHRDDGPAIRWADGTNEWWLNHTELTFDKWLNKVDMSDEDKVMMKLEYG